MKRRRHDKTRPWQQHIETYRRIMSYRHVSSTCSSKRRCSVQGQRCPWRDRQPQWSASLRSKPGMVEPLSFEHVFFTCKITYKRTCLEWCVDMGTIGYYWVLILMFWRNLLVQFSALDFGPVSPVTLFSLSWASNPEFLYMFSDVLRCSMGFQWIP